MKISVTNHTGSRNRGAEALVRTIAKEIKRKYKHSELILHSNDYVYDKHILENLYDDYIFSYIIKTPNHFSNKIVNKAFYKIAYMIEKIINKSLFSSLSQLKESDLTIITGGDILTSDYKNFRKHAAYLLESNAVYILAQTVGPFNKADEKYFLKCLEKVKYITVREKESYDYLSSLNLDIPIEHTSDVAFLLSVLEDEDYNKVKTMICFPFEDKTYVTLSISKGIVKYSSLDEEAYKNKFKELIGLIINDGYNVVIVPHVQECRVNNNDLLFGQELVKEINNKKVFIVGHNLNSVEYKTIISKSVGLIGTRTHTTIASYSTFVPTISIAYSRKAYGIAKDLFGDNYENYVFDVENFDINILYKKFKNLLNIDIDKEIIEAQRLKAKRNFDILDQLL